jgi:hypothetical protein
MQRVIRTLLAILAMTIFTGCATPSAKMPLGVEPPVQRTSNPSFDASISPVDDHSLSPQVGYKAFLLTIENKTGEFLEIIWSETFFIDPRGENGRFMIDDEANFRNNPLQPDVVFPRDNSVITIWPENLAHFYGGQFSRWAHNNMDAGENGILLTVRLKEKIITEKIVLTISYPQDPPQK